MSHGCRIHETATDITMETMCPFSYDQHVLPQCTFLLCCCENFHVILYLVGNWTDMTQIYVQQYVFMFTQYYHSILCMPYFHTKGKQYYHCVMQCQYQIQTQNYTHKVACVNGDIYYIISWEVIYSSYAKYSTSFSTCTHIRYP